MEEAIRQGLSPVSVKEALRAVTQAIPLGVDQARVFAHAIRCLKDPEAHSVIISSNELIHSRLPFEGLALKTSTGKYRMIYRRRGADGIEWISIGHRREIYGRGGRN